MEKIIGFVLLGLAINFIRVVAKANTDYTPWRDLSFSDKVISYIQYAGGFMALLYCLGVLANGLGLLDAGD
jgi:hypothetical protein